ncbi:MAG: NUDIX domain-containing protein [Acidimicrobiales bacterium]
MGKLSAGIVLYRRAGGGIEVLLVHPGGPFWSRREERAWSIPKGEVGDGEDPKAVARREFSEETGAPLDGESWIELGEVVQAGGKRVLAWALEGDLEASCVRSNTFEMQWPPRSGRTQVFAEIDRAKWCSPAEASVKLVAAQVRFVERLATILKDVELPQTKG